MIRRGARAITFSTRILAAAESFALDHGISLADTTTLGDWGKFDIVILGTNHSEYVIKTPQERPHTRLILDFMHAALWIQLFIATLPSPYLQYRAT